MSNERNESFVFYASFDEAFSELDDAQYGKIMRAINKYAIYEIEPELNGMLKAMFILIKPQLDANIRRRTKGTTGGRPTIDDDIRGAIIDDLLSGETQQRIAEKYKVSQGTVSNINNLISKISLSKTQVFNNNNYQKPEVNDNNNYQKPNVNVNDNVNDNANNYLSRKNFGTPIPEEAQSTNDAQNKTTNPLPPPTASDSDESIKTPAEKNESDTKTPRKLRPPDDTQTKTQKPIDKNARKLSEKLYALHKKLDPQFTCTQARLDNWASEIEKLQRLDKRPYDEIEAVIEWAKADSFWQVNIISAEKLRKQYSRLLLQMQKQKTNRPRDDTKLYEQQDFSKNALPEVLKQSRLSEQKDINLDDVIF